MGPIFRPSSSIPRLLSTQAVSDTLGKPALFLGCANSYQEDRKRNLLIRERQGIANLLRGVRGLELMVEDPSKGRFIFDQLRSQHFRWRDSILHLSGFSQGNYLHLEGGLGEEPLTPEQVATLASRLPGLKLVFLNGCGTPELIRQLMRRDIPAVIATQANQQRTHHSALAYSFYDSLKKGRSIRQAFERLMRGAPETVQCYPVDYLLEQDEFVMDEIPLREMKFDSLKGGLYIQADRQHELNWQLVHTPPPKVMKAS